MRNLKRALSLALASVMLLGMMVAFVKDLSTDPSAIRRTYARTAVDNAVVRGLETHGDDFEFAVAEAPEGRGAGADFDSTAENVTEWYRRKDEDGNDVGYDYETETWSDGWEPNPDPKEEKTTPKE